MMLSSNDNALAGVSSNTSEHVVSYFQDRIADINFVNTTLGNGANSKRPLDESRYSMSIRHKRRTRSYLSYKIPRRIKIKQFLEKKKKIENLSGDKKIRAHNGLLKTRKSRRKHSLMLATKRSCDQAYPVSSGWLMTHIWHSKRMHMGQYWGLRLASNCMSRGISAVGRFLKKSAVVHDTSYWSLLQIRCLTVDQLQLLFKDFTDPSGYNFWEDSDVLAGCKEHEFIIYRRNAYPRDCAGPAKIFFPPDMGGPLAGANPKVWLWCHPACFRELATDLDISLSATLNITGSPRGYISQAHEISRFSLRGFRAARVLSNVFWPSLRDDERHPFFLRLMSSEGMPRVWKDRTVLSIEALDVRALQIRAFRKKTSYRHDMSRPVRTTSKEEWYEKLIGIDSEDIEHHKISWPKTAAISRIYSDISGSQMTSDFDMNTNRHVARKSTLKSMPMTGASDCNESPKTSLPVSLIRINYKSWKDLPAAESLFSEMQELNRFDNTGDPVLSGWDIIVPSEWSRAVWKALQFAGANAVGLREMEYLTLECGSPSFPRDYPDSPAGKEHWAQQKDELGKTLSKLPAKNTPFYSNMIATIPDFDVVFPHLSNNDEIVTIRSSIFARPFMPIVQSSNIKSQKKIPLWKKMLEAQSSSLKYEYSSFEKIPQKVETPFPSLPFKTVVSVFARSTSRGVLKPGAVFYGMTPDDLLNWRKCQSNKRAANLSGCKRLGEWPGILLSTSSASRISLGYVTSGGSSFIFGGSNAIGSCEIVTFRDYVIFLKEHQPSPNVIFPAITILFKNPGSGWLRPAEIKILMAV